MPRSAAVAGSFYPYSKDALTEELDECFSKSKDITLSVPLDSKIYGIVAPHAGYQYSGAAAAAVYSLIHDIDSVIIIGPNHTGVGPEISVYPKGEWATPLGQVRVDKDLTSSILESPLLTADEWAHEQEHSVEVQIPFLQSVLKNFEIVPICMKQFYPDERFLEVAIDFGKVLASAISASKKRVLIVASSDFSHYIPEDEARSKDSLAMEKIENMDTKDFFSVVAEQEMSICGYGAIAATIAACKALGAKKGIKVAYSTLADTLGHGKPVVGYGSLAFI